MLPNKSIKLGKLHSASNMKLRAQRFDKKYGMCRDIQISDYSDSSDENCDQEFYDFYIQSSNGFKGFTYQTSELNRYYMVQEMIEELEMHLNFTSDEEDNTDEPERIILPLNFDFKRGLTLQSSKSTVHFTSEEYLLDEGEPVVRRPISRLSLEEERFEDTPSNYDSDAFFWESEGEDNDPKKVIYGLISGVSVGDTWRNRRECSKSLVHVPYKSRIHAGVKASCSIVLSSRIMVFDEGTTFAYFGKARFDRKKIAMVNELVGGNKALKNNFLKGIPVRVVRSYQLGNKYAPKNGLRYDGLYNVEEVTEGKYENGYQYCQANFRRCDNQPPAPWVTSNSPVGTVPDHLLSPTEIDYTSGEEYESAVTDIENTPDAPPATSTPEDVLGSRSKSKPIVRLKRLSAAEIERATKPYLWQHTYCKPCKDDGKRNKKPGRPKEKGAKSSQRTPSKAKQRKASAKGAHSGKRKRSSSLSSEKVESTSVKLKGLQQKKDGPLKPAKKTIVKRSAANETNSMKTAKKSASSSPLKQNVKAKGAYPRREMPKEQKVAAKRGPKPKRKGRK